MLAVNTLLFLQGLWKIYKFVAKRKAEKPKVDAFGYFGCYLAWKLPKSIHDAFTGNAINNAFAIHYDTDSSKVIVDNAANCHICNDKSMFVSDITPIPATANWFEYLKSGIEERGFMQSEVDPCVFYRKDTRGGRLAQLDEVMLSML